MLSHLEQPGTYVRLLLMDFSSAFNTIILNTGCSGSAVCLSQEGPAEGYKHGPENQIFRHPLHSLEEIASSRCRRRSLAILKDLSQPAHHLFELMPSGKR
ncbi:hypothetical protein GOODEAATRI_011956 [Goodea atripinnis]|uniref:Uncharacterized protein n=1 Tax=Goodea atripinnis TaxID=208336 RepID=A0ABV0MH30_9TELE